MCLSPYLIGISRHPSMVTPYKWDQKSLSVTPSSCQRRGRVVRQDIPCGHQRNLQGVNGQSMIFVRIPLGLFNAQVTETMRYAV